MSQGTGFWSDAATEPKRSFRWLLNINGIDAWIIKSVTKPKFEVKESKHSFLNYEFKYPGRVTYTNVTVELVDPISPDASATLVTMLRAGGYVFPGDFDMDQPITISKQKAVDALGHVYIKMLDDEGKNFIEAWALRNAWIKSIAFGDLKYETDDLITLKMEIAYDWAELNPTRDNRLGVAPDRGLPSAAAQDAFNRAFDLS